MIPSPWRRRWLIISLVLTLIWGALLIAGVPLVRGPAPWPPEWRWLYEPLGGTHLARQGVQILLLLAYLVTSLFILRTRQVRWGLLLAVGFFFLWQGVQTWVREESLWDTLIFRTYAPTMNGYLLAPAQVQHVSDTLHHYVDAIPTFFSEKPRTHPPGLFLFYAVFNGLFARWADFSAWLAPIARGWALPGRDWPQLPDHLIASAWVTAWVQMALVSLTPLALYDFLRQNLLPNSTIPALHAALAYPLIPAAALFLSQWDAVYPLLGLLAWSTALRGLASSRGWAWWLLSGLILSLMTWLSYGLLIMVPMVGLYLLWHGWEQRSEGLSWLRSLGWMLLGWALPWLAAWVVWDMALPSLFMASLSQHYDLVTHARRYSIWLWANGLDLALWLGPGILLLAGVSTIGLVRSRHQDGWMRPLAALALIWWGMVVLLDVSGVSRGEVGRLWIFLMPYPLALALIPQWTWRQRGVLMVMMAAWSWVVGWVIPPFGI